MFSSSIPNQRQVRTDAESVRVSQVKSGNPMKVEILEQLEDGSQRRLATFEHRDGVVTCDNPVLWKNLMNATGGAIIGTRGKKYTPDDGVEFLKSLRFHFAGPYLFAGPPMETLPDPNPQPKILPSQAISKGFSAATPRTSSPIASSSPVSTPVRGTNTTGSGAQTGQGMSGNGASTNPILVSPPRITGGSVAASSVTPGARPGTSTGSLRPTGKLDRPASTSDSAPMIVSRTPRASESAAREATPEVPRPVTLGPELTPEMQEQLYGHVYRLAAGLRAVNFAAVESEADNLFALLTRVAQIDVDALRKSIESQEEYRELRFLLATRSHYVRTLDRIGRMAHAFIEILAKGELTPAFQPLFFLREAASGIQEQRAEWRANHALDIPQAAEPFASSALELQAAWGEVGLPAFRRKGLSAGILEELFRQSVEPFKQAAIRFQKLEFGACEEELRFALMRDPGNTDARLLLGDLLRRLDRFDAALLELDRMVELEQVQLRTGVTNPSKPSAFFRLARGRVCMSRCLLSLGRIRECIEQLEQGIEALDQLHRRFPDDILEGPERSRLRSEQGQLHEMLEVLYRALGDIARAEHHRRALNHP